MKVIYDISVLGLGHHSDMRAGVFRVVENLAYSLANSQECDLSFCSTFSLKTLYHSLDYLKENPQLNHIPFISSKIEKYCYRRLNDLFAKVNSVPSSSLSLKVWRKLLFHTINLVEFNSLALDSNNLFGCDIFHSPHYPLPEQTKRVKKLQRFLTVCDLFPILYPHFFELHNKQTFSKILQSLESSDWILCISHATKYDLCNYLKSIDASRVFVTHLAASTLFYQCKDLSQLTAVRDKYCIPALPYILSLSTLEPRKNITHTVKCFVRLVQEQKIKDLCLVLVGKKGWNYDSIFDEIYNSDLLKKRIIVTGYVADEDLAPLYSGALAFVYPSFCEGFGLPPLEAMQCGVPVITSNTSSLPEVVGDAGIMLAPTDSDGLCHSMLELYKRPSLQEAMSLKSLKQAKKFSWQKFTQETISAYKSSLSG